MRLASLLLCSLALLAAGCGGDDEAEPAATPEPAAETAAPGGDGVVNTIKDFEFDPVETKVTAGGEVEWTNEDTANHNVIFDGDKAENIDNLRQGQSGKVTFADAGEYAYVCSYHPGMEGTVVVE